MEWILKTAREAPGLTQGQLARKRGLSDAYVNQIETARTDPPTRAVCKALARALNADELELWKRAFVSRLERWLRKEGIKQAPADLLANFFDTLTKRE
jgi:transcriptional regulator with XRE-family HTH domain